MAAIEQRFYDGPVPTLDDEQATRAARYVAGAAEDAEDARLLLAALGLVDSPPPLARPVRGGRQWGLAKQAAARRTG